jgi:hypothetical protein
MNSGMKASRNRVVARYRDGRILKGYTHDFLPMKDTFHLTSEDAITKGTIHEVNIADLKAIFFVKTFDGNKFYHEKKKFEEVDDSKLRGLKIKVEFFDGEVIRGISLGYNKNKKGFFISDIDPDSNNERIFVIADACKSVQVGQTASS